MHKFESLEPRRLLSDDHPVGINFNDELLWDANFPTAVAQAKSVGVTSVRLWLGFGSYSNRPQTWDPSPSWQSKYVEYGKGYSNSQQQVMQRAFDLHRAGFKVLLSVVPTTGLAPASDPQEVRGLFTHLKNATETPTSTETLADVVDYWQVGNEPDQPSYWVESPPDGENKTEAIKGYVDKFLIPAAQALKSGDKSTWETVISAGPSWSYKHLETILSQLKLRGALGLIDMAGYHPYGVTDTESTPNDTQQRDRVLPAIGVAKKYGKPLVATEWNTRGYTAGWLDPQVRDKWARMLDQAYHDFIVENFKQLYYFSLVDNYALRGGRTSARPGGILKHNAPDTSVIEQSPAYIESWLKKPLVPNEPFYSTVSNWQWGTVSGVVVNSNPGDSLDGRVVYVDVNNNGQLDSSEPKTVTAIDGKYVLKYGSREVATGTYEVRLVVPDGWTTPDDDRTLALRASRVAGNTNFTLTKAAAPVTTGSVSGKLFRDDNANGVINTGEPSLAGKTVYIDLNNNSILDVLEPAASTATDGTFTISYDTVTTPIGGYALRQILTAADWEQTTATPAIVVGAGRIDTGLKIGSRIIPPIVIDPPPPPPPPPTPTATGVIGGYLFNDGNDNGVQDGTEGRTPTRVVYIDANTNGKLDTGEKSTTSNVDGVYSFSNLAAGTYNVTRVFPNGFRLSNSSIGYIAVAIADAEVNSTVNVGSTSLPLGVKPPVIIDPPPPTPTDTGVISGYLFNDGNDNGVQDGSEGRTPSRVVFIDSNANGTLDTGEKSITSAVNGVYSFTGLAAGTYNITRVFPKGFRLSNSTIGYIPVTIAAAEVNSITNIGSTSLPPGTLPPVVIVPPPPPPTTPPATSNGVIGGYLFNDGNDNGVQDGGEGRTPTRAVYLDTNANGKFDSGEKSTTSNSTGVYSFSSLAAGTYNVSRVFPPGFRLSNSQIGYVPVTLADNEVNSTVNIGSTSLPLGANPPPVVTPPPVVIPPVVVTPPATTATGSISGYLFYDNNANGSRNSNESYQNGKVVYLDTNNNDKLDSNEKQITTKSMGAFSFSGLTAGTYTVRRVLPVGYKITTPLRVITLLDGQNVTGVAIGTGT